jgi:hypothetical protein
MPEGVRFYGEVQGNLFIDNAVRPNWNGVGAKISGSFPYRQARSESDRRHQAAHP